MKYLEDELDKLFPKNKSKERGNALVLFAQFNLLISKKIMELNKKLNEICEQKVKEAYEAGKKNTRKQNDLLFVPFSQDDFLPGSNGIEYLNEIIWLLIENLNELKEQ